MTIADGVHDLVACRGWARIVEVWTTGFRRLWTRIHVCPFPNCQRPRATHTKKSLPRADEGAAGSDFVAIARTRRHPSSPGRLFNNRDLTVSAAVLLEHSADTVGDTVNMPIALARKSRQVHLSPAPSSQPATVSAIRTSAGMPRPWCNLRIMPSVKGRLWFRTS